jgi:hypothetical protein
MKFFNYLNEAESQIRDQLLSIKNGTDEWDIILRKWITGQDEPFSTVGHGRFTSSAPKNVPNAIKRKYPDIIFAIHALQKHMGMEKYYSEWEAAKKYLTFKPQNKSRTFYRFWSITEEQLKALKNNKSVPIVNKSEYSSYSRHKSLFSYDKNLGITAMNIGTETLLKTGGQALTLVTQHTFTPVFDLAYFALHLLNNVKLVFNIDKFGLEKTGFATINNYVYEREVIGPAVNSIKPQDVVGYYKQRTFNKLDGDEYLIDIDGKIYTFLPNNIEKFKQSLQQYDNLDMTFFNNNVIITSDVEKSHMKMYTKKLTLNKELSKLVGVDIYAGLWR